MLRRGRGRSYGCACCILFMSTLVPHAEQAPLSHHVRSPMRHPGLGLHCSRINTGIGWGRGLDWEQSACPGLHALVQARKNDSLESSFRAASIGWGDRIRNEG